MFKVGTELASTHSKSTMQYDSTTAKQTTVNSGGSLLIVASGQAAGTAGDIRVLGSKLKAADTLLLAKNDITFESAQTPKIVRTIAATTRPPSGPASTSARRTVSPSTWVPSSPKARGAVTTSRRSTAPWIRAPLKLQSGNDTTLAGAQIHADSIQALVGGDLNIASRQDTSEHKNKQTSGGFGASICVPPFCYGETQ